eukprot:COSAG03_NODE_19705_length_331_cov_1.137931_1_plen_64_part_10
MGGGYILLYHTRYVLVNGYIRRKGKSQTVLVLVPVQACLVMSLGNSGFLVFVCDFCMVVCEFCM